MKTNRNERTCTCGHHIAVNSGVPLKKNGEIIDNQLMVVDNAEYDLFLYNCPQCWSTLSEKRSK